MLLNKKSYSFFIFLSALIIRLFFLTQTIHHPLFIPIPGGLDPSLYHNTALEILSGNFCGIHYGTFLYPLFLAFVYLFSNVLVAKILQFIVGSLSCVLIYFITKKVFNKKSAYIASAIAVIYPVSIIHESILIYVSLTVFLNLLSILILLNMPIKKIKLFFSGFLLGLSFILSPSVAFFVIGCLAWIFFFYFKRSSFKKAVCFTFIFFFGFLSIYTPFALRNFACSGHVSPTTACFGIGFYIGNNPDSEGIFKTACSARYSPKGQMEDFMLMAENKTNKKLTDFQASMFWIKQSFKYIKENPFKYAKLELNKFLLFFNKREYSDLIQDINYFKIYSFLILILSIISFGVIGPLGLMGIFIAVKSFDFRKKLLFIYIISYLFFLMFFYITSRYRLPAVYGFFPFAGYFLLFFVKQIIKKRYRTLFLLSFGLFFCIIFVNLNLKPSFLNKVSHYNRGVIYMSSGKISSAKEEYQKALYQDPFDVNAHFGMGEIFFKQEKYKQALYEFKKCLEINPRFLDAYYNLGLIFFKLKQYDKSFEYFKKLILLNPKDAGGHFYLGSIYFIKDFETEAEKEFKLAVKLNPDFKKIITKFKKEHL